MMASKLLEGINAYLVIRMLIPARCGVISCLLHPYSARSVRNIMNKELVK